MVEVLGADLNIIIKVIPSDQHRPGISGGDWYFDEAGDLQVRVTKMADERMEIALALHEAFEAVLCKAQGVTVSSVDVFDDAFTKKHPENGGLNAGDEPDCPYAKAHSQATAAERIYTAEVGLCWSEYDKVVGKL